VKEHRFDIIDGKRQGPEDGAPNQVQPLDARWEKTRILLREISNAFVFGAFFESLIAVDLEDGLLQVAAPNPFHRDWVSDHYADVLRQAACEAFGETLEVALVHLPGLPEPGPLPTPPQATPPQEAPAKPPGVPSPSPRKAAPVLKFKPRRADSTSAKNPRPLPAQINPHYTFENFVPGPSNQMALAACEAVAEAPARHYSPLFLFGGVGLGKTHLMHAIGNAALLKNPDLRVVYMSAEAWVNEYIREIRAGRFDAFRARYRGGCDLLLIDDIQFLGGKDSSQDEFFHTFNTLHAANKQIVVTSDQYPHQIPGLEERLQTRLSWGLIADIQVPKMETRIAILQQKAEACGIALPPEVATYLANHITTSVRELEGALLRLSAYAQLTSQPISLARAKDVLKPVLRQQHQALTVAQVQEAVANYYDLKVADLLSKSRKRQVTLARQIAMALCRRHLQLSLPEIGRAFGGRDHTTVLASVRKIAGLEATCAGTRTVLKRLEDNLLTGTPLSS
jgi:chromosomal replication initiator protein